jgi:hypothetical protein
MGDSQSGDSTLLKNRSSGRNQLLDAEFIRGAEHSDPPGSRQQAKTGSFSRPKKAVKYQKSNTFLRF